MEYLTNVKFVTKVSCKIWSYGGCVIGDLLTQVFQKFQKIEMHDNQGELLSFTSRKITYTILLL